MFLFLDQKIPLGTFTLNPLQLPCMCRAESCLPAPLTPVWPFLSTLPLGPHISRPVSPPPSSRVEFPSHPDLLSRMTASPRLQQGFIHCPQYSVQRKQEEDCPSRQAVYCSNRHRSQSSLFGLHPQQLVAVARASYLNHLDDESKSGDEPVRDRVSERQRGI